jgi:hypothetical protein
VSKSQVAAWWITPGAVGLMLPYSLVRAISRRKG